MPSGTFTPALRQRFAPALADAGRWLSAAVPRTTSRAGAQMGQKRSLRHVSLRGAAAGRQPLVVRADRGCRCAGHSADPPATATLALHLLPQRLWVRQWPLHGWRQLYSGRHRSRGLLPRHSWETQQLQVHTRRLPRCQRRARPQHRPQHQNDQRCRCHLWDRRRLRHCPVQQRFHWKDAVPLQRLRCRQRHQRQQTQRQRPQWQRLQRQRPEWRRKLQQQRRQQGQPWQRLAGSTLCRPERRLLRCTLLLSGRGVQLSCHHLVWHNSCSRHQTPPVVQGPASLVPGALHWPHRR